MAAHATDPEEALPRCILYRRIVIESAQARALHSALDNALCRLDEAEARPGCGFLGAFLPGGEWTKWRKECSYHGALGATDGAWGRDPGNWIYGLVFRVWLDSGPPLERWQAEGAGHMGDEKLGDVLEATLSLGRPGLAWRQQALPHVEAITAAVEAAEDIVRWAWASGAVSGPWPSTRWMAELLM